MILCKILRTYPPRSLNYCFSQAGARAVTFVVFGDTRELHAARLTFLAHQAPFNTHLALLQLPTGIRFVGYGILKLFVCSSACDLFSSFSLFSCV